MLRGFACLLYVNTESSCNVALSYALRLVHAAYSALPSTARLSRCTHSLSAIPVQRCTAMAIASTRWLPIASASRHVCEPAGRMMYLADELLCRCNYRVCLINRCAVISISTAYKVECECRYSHCSSHYPYTRLVFSLHTVPYSLDHLLHICMYLCPTQMFDQLTVIRLRHNIDAFAAHALVHVFENL